MSTFIWYRVIDFLKRYICWEGRTTEGGRELRREKFLIYWFTPQISNSSQNWTRLSQEQRIPSGSPTQVSRAQILGPSSDALPGVLSGGWMGREAVRTQTITDIDATVAASGLLFRFHACWLMLSAIFLAYTLYCHHLYNTVLKANQNRDANEETWAHNPSTFFFHCSF